LLPEYQHGQRDSALLKNLVNAAKQIKDDSVAALVASTYIHYLEGLSDVSLWTTDNIQFVEGFINIIHTDDIIFHRLIDGAVTIDSVMGKGVAQHFINYVVYNEVVKPKVDAAIKDSIEPAWGIIEKDIQGTYGDYYAERCVVSGRVKFYKARKQWESYAKYFVRLIEIIQINTWTSTASIDNNAFEVFKYSNNPNELEEALSWINRALSLENPLDGADVDTKANLLYKLGKKDEAFSLEETACRLLPNNKELAENYDKMKKGLPTW